MWEKVNGKIYVNNDISSNIRICQKIAAVQKAGSPSRIHGTFSNHIYRRIAVVPAAASSNLLHSAFPIYIWRKIRDVPAAANSNPDHPVHSICLFLRLFRHPWMRKSWPWLSYGEVSSFGQNYTVHSNIRIENRDFWKTGFPNLCRSVWTNRTCEKIEVVCKAILPSPGHPMYPSYRRNKNADVCIAANTSPFHPICPSHTTLQTGGIFEAEFANETRIIFASHIYRQIEDVDIAFETNHFRSNCSNPMWLP